MDQRRIFLLCISNIILYSSIVTLAAITDEKSTEIGPILTATVVSCPVIFSKLDSCFNKAFNSWTIDDDYLKRNCCSSFMVFDCLKPIIKENCETPIYQHFLNNSKHYQDNLKSGSCSDEKFIWNCEITIPFYWIIIVGVIFVMLIIIALSAISCLICTKRRRCKPSSRGPFELRSDSFVILSFV